jgi:flagellar biogenesis protein FliO
MNTGPDLTMAAIKMIMALGVVLLMVWGLYRLARGKLAVPAGGGRQKLIRIVESQYVGVKKSIAMVQIPGSLLVLGVGTDSVNLLTQIDDPEILGRIAAASKDRPAASFKAHLQRLVSPTSRKPTHVDSDGSVSAPCDS